MATPTDDDNADDCISGDSYRCERGFTLTRSVQAESFSASTNDPYVHANSLDTPPIPVGSFIVLHPSGIQTGRPFGVE